MLRQWTHTFMMGAALLTLACGGGKSSTSSSSGSGGSSSSSGGSSGPGLPQLQATATGYEITVSNWEVPPGGEVKRCMVLEGLPEAVVVQRVEAVQAAGGHHITLFTTNAARPGSVNDCTPFSAMAVFTFLAPPQFDGRADNLAFTIPAHKNIVIQSHYINATTHPLTAADTFRLTRPLAGSNPAMVDFFAVTNVTFLMSTGAAEVVQNCTLDKDMVILSQSGHMHDLGTHYKFEQLVNDVPQVLSDYTWDAHYGDLPQSQYYPPAAPLLVHAGDKLRTTCSYNNTRGREVEFPEEMCATFGFYLINQDWPGGFLTCTVNNFTVEP